MPEKKFPNNVNSQASDFTPPDKMDIEQIVGISAGVFTAISLLPQLIKILKEKKAQDISLFYLFVLLTGLGLWIWYGILKEDLPIIITNIVSASLNVATLLAGMKYKSKK